MDLREAFIDGSFAPAKKGGAGVGTTKRGKGSKIMAIAHRHGRPVAIHIDTATPHEVTLVKTTLSRHMARPGGGEMYYLQLDGMLACAVLAVIANHTFYTQILPYALGPGGAGVRLFFVLTHGGR